jgi:hypothetical protein
MRLRQFVFVAEDLKAAVVDIGATLGLPVCFNDPGVGRFGLHNALLPIGGDLIEVVAPIREGPRRAAICNAAAAMAAI